MALAVLRYPGLGTVHVVGGAHLSEDSKEAAIAAVVKLQPNEVLLELCHERQDMLDPRHDRPAEPLPPLLQLFTEKTWTALNPYFWFIHLPMAGLAALCDATMGGEMRAACHAAAVAQIPVRLIDREVSVTLLRAAAAASQALEVKITRSFVGHSNTIDDKVAEHLPILTKENNLFPNNDSNTKRNRDRNCSRNGNDYSSEVSGHVDWWKLCWGMLRGSSLTDEEFARLSVDSRNMVSDMLDSLDGQSSRNLFGKGDIEKAVFGVIGNERDKILAYQCVQAAGRVGPNGKVVAVVGAAHTAGIEDEWCRLVDRGWPVPTHNFYAQPRGMLRIPRTMREQNRTEDFALMEALYDVEEPRQQLVSSLAKFVAADFAGVVVAGGVYRYARQRGGVFFNRTRRLFRVAALASMAGTLGTLTVAKLGYDGVRSLQARRKKIWEEQNPTKPMETLFE